MLGGGYLPSGYQEEKAMKEKGLFCYALEEECNNHVRSWGKLGPVASAPSGYPRMFGRARWG